MLNMSAIKQMKKETTKHQGNSTGICTSKGTSAISANCVLLTMYVETYQNVKIATGWSI